MNPHFCPVSELALRLLTKMEMVLGERFGWAIFLVTYYTV